ncbi:hypothetical protein [Thalassotalea sp. PP2-459]|uniref:hypothetical protein n=1 Tax=Thalassotalea sp. PP2-459 TaxID=1742724 RepID=UPI0009453ECF|nr:hypothetical protein [Thalassotalea sp. PP2-459]OKY26251.1 hypothetical protein BI291_12865 [Thalassotalea sp. PP2-459]
MKSLISMVIMLSATQLVSSCATPQEAKSYEDAYSAQQQCNGEMEVTHSMVIHSNNEEVESPTVTSVCQPSTYETQTDFEKENRRENY